MKVLVLGSAASGGARHRMAARPPRTLSSLAISPDGRRWALVNASPDIGAQLRRHAELTATTDDGAPALRAVLLTSAEVDVVGGLLGLHDGPTIDLYATPGVFDDLTGGLPLLTVLQHYCDVRWQLLNVAGEQHAVGFRVDGLDPLRFEAFALPGLPPPYSSHRGDPVPGDRIALRVHDPASRRSLTYAPGLAGATGDAIESLRDADCLLLDGGAWPRRDGAVPTSSLPELLQGSRATRKVLLHLRADDPLLEPGSAERRRLLADGIEVGDDGMAIEL